MESERAGFLVDSRPNSTQYRNEQSAAEGEPPSKGINTSGPAMDGMMKIISQDSNMGTLGSPAAAPLDSIQEILNGISPMPEGPSRPTPIFEPGVYPVGRNFPDVAPSPDQPLPGDNSRDSTPPDTYNDGTGITTRTNSSGKLAEAMPVQELFEEAVPVSKDASTRASRHRAQNRIMILVAGLLLAPAVITAASVLVSRGHTESKPSSSDNNFPFHNKNPGSNSGSNALCFGATKLFQWQH